ncbi:META domain-containing protein [Flavobacterium sp.]|uniref:META domain-containing protein n=1 Tax=Flavobacterium sp. TaxID=239 RepID=UPI00248A8CAA|nr:META domain-containing protein [Flavobacterium sp.]MDI1317124.1 META domain-containing protein [Flavobacterium sp.]
MKNIYFTIAILFLGFVSCKNNDTTTESSDTFIDSTAIQQDSITAKDTLSYVSDTVSTQVDSSDAKSNVKLPNKISETTTVISGEKGKFPLAETKWELVELNGKTVAKTTKRDYFINFDSKSGTFKAFVGCNKISGNYFMKSTTKLGFTNVISTRMACENMDVERNFFNNLQKTDNYMIEGKMLHLHMGKKAIAKFEAIK